VSMVAISPQIGSAFFVLCGRHGAVTLHAQDRGISRQRVYREAAAVASAVDGSAARARQEELAGQVAAARQTIAEHEERLRYAVVVDADRQAEFASLAQAEGVSLPTARRLLQVVLGEATPSVATLGRWTHEASVRAGSLLAVLDPVARPGVRQAAADEIFVGRKPILMMVEPDSLCWVGGRLAEHRDGPTWAQEFGQLPALEQVLRDGGTGMEKGLEQINAERTRQGQQAVVQQLDHFHVQQEARRAWRRWRSQAAHALEQAERAQKEVEKHERRGLNKSGVAAQARRCWQEAEAAMDRWIAAEAAWKKLEPALEPFTAEGGLNTRQRAEAVVAAVLPALAGPEWAKVRRMLLRPEMFTYLDRLHEQVEALPGDPSVKRALVRAEIVRRQPKRTQGESVSAAAARGILLVTAALLTLGGESVQEVAQEVRKVLRHTWRASSMVEGLNSVLRMHQARHRRLTQGMLDLKRLYWNCRAFRTGKRRKQTPYQRLGIVLPDMRWWELLKIPAEQLRAELSALNRAA
jgi:hypothetical protein